MLKKEIEEGDIVKIIGDDGLQEYDGLWKVKYIINARATLKEVNGHCFREVNIGSLALVDKNQN